MLNSLDRGRLLESHDGTNFFRVCLDSPLRHDVSKEFSCRDSEGTLGRVQLHLISTQILESFLEVTNQRVNQLGLNHYVIHISMHISPNLFPEAILHCPRITSSCILQTERHIGVAKNSKGGDEGCLLLILNGHLNLMISRVGVEKT